MLDDIFVNLVAGLIGGLIIAVGTQVIRFIQNKRIEKQFPISGDYISRYDDLENGQRVYRTAPATFKQKGKKVIGETTFDGKRTWMIEGEVSPEGNFFGIYHAENPLDKGIGNFFLKVDNDKVMNGMWSGYDSENNLVNSGSYIFRPVNKNIQIVDLETKYIPEIIRIGDQQIGEQFLESEILENCIHKKDKFIGKVAIDLTRNKIAGFIVSFVIEKEELSNIYKKGVEQIPRSLTYANEYGVLKSVAVNEEYKGQSIGTRLVSVTLEEFKKLNITTVFSSAWKSEKGTNMKGIFDSLDFKEVYEIKDYWKEDSLEKQYKCPVCGNPPCRCSAIIYSKFLI